MSASALLDRPAHEIAARVSARELPVRDLVAEALRRAERVQERCNAFVTVAAEAASARAEALDRSLAEGARAGPLCGVPFVAKDNLCTAELRTTAGSRALERFVPPYDATVVARLEAAGAVLIGKTNLDEFGMGSSNEHSAFGAVCNPWHADRVPGGSSGGSAAAVAAGVVPLALGTDTGGSVRQPAGFCGVLGFKPTYGTLSRYGVIAFASSLDQVGVLARDAEDVALAMDAMVGRDPRDATSLAVEPTFRAALEGSGPRLDGVRVGLVAELAAEGNDPAVVAALRDTRERLERLGAHVEELSVPSARAGVASYYLVASAEASSNLARYDGMITGARQGEDALGQAEVMTRSRSRAFGSEVRRRVLMGSFALSAGYADAWYGKALLVRRRLSDELSDAFRRVDLLMTPTTPAPAFELGARRDDPLAMYLGDVDTCLASLVGIGALSVPAGRDDDGLPLAAQLLAPALEDARLLRVADALAADAGPSFAPLAPGVAAV